MHKPRILVADDSEDDLFTVETILEDAYDVRSAKSPAEAIALARELEFSLAILDQRFPGAESGIELLQELRQIRPGLRAIIFTGFNDEDDIVESMKLGATDYLSKGRASVLLARVQNALAQDTDREVKTLLENLENHQLEFKSSARWDLRQSKLNHELEQVIVKTVAGFLNSEYEGVLLIGVDDQRNPIGLMHDYRTVRPQNRDGFQTFLTNLILEACGKDLNSFIRVDFPVVGGYEICRVSIRPAPRPVFVAVGNLQHFYLRTGNATNPLLMADAFAYCKVRWKAP